MFSNDIQAYFEQLVETPSPSGFEMKCQNLFKDYASRYVEHVYKDTFGNVIAHNSCNGKSKLMISAHIDEIGFMVKHIDDDGFLYIVPIGGIDTMLLPGSRLAIHHNGNSFLGIIGRKPIHLLNENERNKVIFEDLWLDCGFTSQKHAQLSVSIGDPITFTTNPIYMSDNCMVTRSADNKVGSAIMMEVMKRLKDLDTNYDIYYASTRQEEIGLRGGITAAANVKPDYTIVIDATHATDYPSVKKTFYGEIALGKGPSISISPDTDEEFRSKFLESIQKKAYPYQIEVHPNASGTESRAIQIQHGGIKTLNISYPVRYMHSASEIISSDDVKDVIEILCNFLISQ
ncbi:MAG: M20/M25/M40 family metallo-hydrolase [Bacteroidetes bacterium]|uniref:M20/M25/M40 family metallo-hydrolase n=1 Tax=Candidatus Gallipaludibacter merdavium TaxID=2840839 RepID=A0A9D9HS61_9BACT|nr:M20/M25/M40 family metallo-hydrolase [Candidatus Gallipaludibacter merdavium]